MGEATKNQAELCRLGLRCQYLISRGIKLGMKREIRQLQSIDAKLSALYDEIKQEPRLSEDEQRARGYTHYIWQTQGDNKVRPSHRANEGKVFAWDKPPSTGHPGEDYGCRCWAEPIHITASQTLLTVVIDHQPPWTTWDFFKHYWSHNPKGVRLAEIGHLGNIINYYGYKAKGTGIYKRVNEQIMEKALSVDSSAFTYSFIERYNFKEVVYSFREATVGGIFTGTVKKQGALVTVSGIINYQFFDVFTDPWSIVQSMIMAKIISRDNVPDWLNEAGDIVGTPYTITGNWQTAYTGSIGPAE